MQSRMSAVILILVSLVATLLGQGRTRIDTPWTYPGGSGTAEDPYHIATAQDLIELGKEPNDYDRHFILTADIDLSAYSFEWAVIAPFMFWADFGYAHQKPPFNGSLDGRGHVIRGLTIRGYDYIGLIGKLGPQGIVRRLKLEDADVQAVHLRKSDSYKANGNQDIQMLGNEEFPTLMAQGYTNYGGLVGALVGESEGQISQCQVTGTVVGNNYTGGLVGRNYGTITDCQVGGEVQGLDYVGGLAGTSYISLLRCVNSADVSGSDYVGGVVGRTKSDISECENAGEIGGSNKVGGLAGGCFYPARVIQSSSTGPVSGLTLVGGLIGSSSCHMTRCWSRSSVFIGDSNYYSTSQAGGLTGSNSGEIVDSFYDGVVDGKRIYTGGLVGINWGGIFRCYSDGLTKGDRVVGGLVGLNDDGTITNCYSNSTVTGLSTIGGLVGRNSGVVKQSYCIGAVSGNDFIGGFAGSDAGGIDGGFWDMESSGVIYSIGGAGLTRAESMDPQWLGLQGFHRDPNWVLDPGQDYPRLIWEETPGQAVPVPTMDWLDGQGTYEDPYQLASADQLYKISKSSSLWETKYYALIADIDLTGYTWTQAIFPSYFAIFRGNGHVVSNVTMRGADYLGLFGRTGEETTILNLRLENVDIEGLGNHVGAMVGVNRGQILYSSTSGRVRGLEDVGGLVGSNKGYLAACFSAGEVHGDNSVGGLAGEGGAVQNCYSTCVIYGGYDSGGLVGLKGKLTNCYATGPVHNIYGSNGLVGDKDSSATGSYWDVQTSGHEAGYAGQGLSTSQMQDINTYLTARWDFAGESANGTSDFWYMPETGGYPRLSVFDGPGSPEMTGQGTAANPYLITDARELGAIWRRPLAFYRLETSLDLQGIQWHHAAIPWFNAGFDGNGQELRNLSINGEASLGLFRTLGDRAAVMELSIEDANILGTGEYVAGLVAQNYGSIENVYCSGSFVGARRVGALAGINYNHAESCSSAGTVLATSDTVGGLIGTNRADIVTCQSDCAVTCSGFFIPVHANYYGFAGGLVGWNSSYNGHIINSFSTGPVFSSRLAGGLAAGNSGTIFNSWSSGLVSGEENYIGGLVGINSGDVSQCSSTGAVDGESWVGGFVGHNSGTITRSYSGGPVTCQQEGGGFIGYLKSDGVIVDCYSIGDVTGESKVGGFVGNSTTETVIANCYSTGFVIGTDDHGGFSGDGEADIDRCFWDFQTSGQTWSNDGRKLPTAEMQNINTYLNAGWDFINETENGTDDIWYMPENDYPRHSWELPEAE